MSKTIEQRFKLLTPIEHVLKRPGRYLGSTKPHTGATWVFAQDAMVQREETWNPGLLKMFDEIISNSVDHSKRPEGKHLDRIEVKIDRATGKISVKDNGGIPVQMHGDHQMYVPTLIFGHLLSGENFDDDNDSVVTGQNGEGASLVNIFSTSFSVETSDGKKRFNQLWNDNMHVASSPLVIDLEGAPYTVISFTPDYARLGITSTDGMMLDDGNWNKLVKRVYDIAGCNPKLKVSLNGAPIRIKSFKDYINLYAPKFEYDENEYWQIGVAASEDGFQHVSFVNSTETVQGGTHVGYVWYQIASELREFIRKKHKIDVKPSEIQSHMRIFINATIVRPRYDSQTKENLITEVKEYKTAWVPSAKFIKKVIEAGVVDRVLTWAEAKAKAEEIARLKDLNKDVAKGNPRRVEKFSDAMEDHRRDLCELYITEGDSARKSIHESRGKNPYIGSFALKGKPLNVMDIDLKRILGGGKDDDGNTEIKNILKITGLKIGEKVKSIHDLRFGKIVILSDQDLDGFHVSALLINFFAYFWPELFELGVIYRMNTPLVIAKDTKKVEHEFFSDAEYEEWAKTAPKHEPRRFKGLGTFPTSIFKTLLEKRERYLVRVGTIKDAGAEAIRLAFRGDRADDRKEWLADVNYFSNFD